MAPMRTPVVPKDGVRTPTAIDERDQGTADDWVPRLPIMNRLTGRHPFNAEAPPKDLLDAGFITPTPMHYVRNHGPVPKLSWETHKLILSGIGIEGEVSLSMDELAALPRRTIPVTLVCAGNRRKEVNVTKQSKGFHWGPAGLSTAVYTGVPLYQLLAHLGITAETANLDHYVIFDGPDAELPKGVYGTSIPMRKALDPSQDVMVAFEQNGEPLSPDHGYPIRIIIPGYIGGRMVKWLTRIYVSQQESQSWYHYHDNRVLPSMIEPERAEKEGWWFKPEYMINDLNINSAITHPTQHEDIPITSGTYKLRGYAYNGGGRRISRIELSFDDGKTWEVTNASNEEYPTEFGRFWCWRFWDYEVDIVRLMASPVICLRAWDESTNAQPRDLTWNILGQMNNCWYKVRPIIRKDANGTPVLRLEHPAMVGPVGGWMIPEVPAQVEAKAVPGGGAAKAQPAAVDPAQPRFHPTEVAKHKKKDDCWIVVHGKVYDVTSYLGEHPGGVAAIVMGAGGDVTEDFDAIHSSKAHAMLSKYYIGVLDENAPLTSSAPANSAIVADKAPTNAGGAAEEAAVALKGKGVVSCKLIEKVYESPDVVRVRFALPLATQRLGITVGQHVALKVKVNGKLVKRAYTPITEPDEIGDFVLLVRVYRAGQHPKFPEGGMMSQYLDRMEVGQYIDVEGPTGHIQYEGPGVISHLGDKMVVKHFAMVAGGTGITPCWQVLRAVLKNKEDPTTVSLVYAARSPSELLLRNEMDALAKEFSNFKVWYTVDTFDNEEQKEAWAYDTGFINESILKRVFPSAGDDVAVLMCGPPPMLKFAVTPALEKMGFHSEQQLSF